MMGMKGEHLTEKRKGVVYFCNMIRQLALMKIIIEGKNEGKRARGRQR